MKTRHHGNVLALLRGYYIVAKRYGFYSPKNNKIHSLIGQPFNVLFILFTQLKLGLMLRLQPLDLKRLENINETDFT